MYKCAVDIVVVVVVVAVVALHAMTYRDMLLCRTTAGSCLLQHRVRKVLNEYTDNELEETLKAFSASTVCSEVVLLTIITA